MARAASFLSAVLLVFLIYSLTFMDNFPGLVWFVTVYDKQAEFSDLHGQLVKLPDEGTPSWSSRKFEDSLVFIVSYFKKTENKSELKEIEVSTLPILDGAPPEQQHELPEWNRGSYLSGLESLDDREDDETSGPATGTGIVRSIHGDPFQEPAEDEDPFLRQQIRD